MHLQLLLALSSSVIASRTSSSNDQQISAAISEPTPEMPMRAEKAQWLAVSPLIVLGSGINAPFKIICGRISRMTNKGAELALGDKAEANNPNIMPARVTITSVM